MAVLAAPLAAALAIASAIGGHPGTGWKAGLFVFAFWFVVSWRRNETTTLLRGEGDERQQLIRAESAMLTLSITAPILVGAALWELAHGYYGRFGMVCSLVGAVQIVTTLWLRRRR